MWPYLLESYPFTSDSNHIKELERSHRQNYAHVLEECKDVERILMEKERDLLALNGFANGEVFHNNHNNNTSDDTDSIRTHDTDSTIRTHQTNETGSIVGDDNVSRDISINSNISDPNFDPAEPIGCDQSTPTNGVDTDAGKEFSLIKSLLETKASLREMVENASEKGSNAWKNLTAKQRQRSKSFNGRQASNKNTKKRRETFEDLHSKFNATSHQARSFDLELDCQTCGKKIIESRLGVTAGGRLSGDQTIETVECFSCTQERQCNERYEAEVSPYKIGCSPSSVVIDSSNMHRGGVCDDYVVNINGEGTPLQKRTSISSAGSTYSVRYSLKRFCLGFNTVSLTLSALFTSVLISPFNSKKRVIYFKDNVFLNTFSIFQDISSLEKV